MRVQTRSARRRPAAALAAVFLTAALALTGCSGANDSSDASQAADKGAAAPGAQDAAGGEGAREGAAQDRASAKLPAVHIIRTARLTLRVEDVPKAVETARDTVEGAGGVVGSETTDRDADGHERSRIVLRVPQEEYGNVLASLEGAGKLVERKVNAEDVTDQVVDVEARLKTQRASIERVRELMDRATKLSDVVTLEGELSARQAELEALEAKQASLKDRTTLATITLVLAETEVKPEEDDDPTFFEAVAGGWDAFLTTLRWIAVVLGAVLPFAAAVALLFAGWRLLVRPRLPRRPRVPRPAGAS
ncbi:DUF4349 domain-containing protein, partial [Streptomyces sp. GC420]|uniref:DUF4349 domain-containing protein n=1 Tax=Streptomyces sp. GC420 TaxID=2697568 RepID=UPI001415143A